MSYKTRIALFISIFLWASAFVGIRAGLTEYSPESLALLRYLIASIFMGIVYFYYPKRNVICFRDKCGLLFVGAIGIGIYNLTLNRGEILISSGMASFIISQSPLITMFLAIIFLGEKLTLYRSIGFAISILGVSLITFGEDKYFKWDTGLYYILLATIAGGFYSAMQKPFLKKYNIIEATTYVIWGGTFFLLLYSPIHQLQNEIMHISLKSTFTVIYLGIFPAAVAYIAWSYVLTEIDASKAGSFLYFMPFLATLLGWIYLGEIPAWLALAGGLVSIAGVWIINQSAS